MSRVTHARKVAYLIELCAAADSMHRQTSLLVGWLADELPSTKSTLPLKPKRHRRRTSKR